MSVRLLSLVFECDMPELKTDKGQTVPNNTAKFILLALADHANDEGEGCYPSVKRLCKKTNLSTGTVCNALNALRHNGFTLLVGKSKVETNNYTISVARIKEFQWVESDDSSGWNQSVPVARIKSSVNHESNHKINTYVLPPVLQASHEFISAWDSFLKHRKQLKKTLTPLAAERTLKKLSQYAIPVAIEALNRSVENGWTGVFPESVKVGRVNGTNQIDQRLPKGV